MSRRETTLVVDACPYCAKAHSYRIEITERAVEHGLEAVARTNLSLACLVDGRVYIAEADLSVPKGHEFKRAELVGYVTD